MTFYGDDIIERVREASDIVDVISEFLPLKRKGRNYWARCPFHQEKTPSFSVSPEKQIFHCFGCQKGGNVFSFVMEYEKLPFPETLKYLAKRAHIELPSVTYRRESKEIERLYFAHEVAAEFFFENLKSSTSTLEYLRERKVSDEVIERFKLGYALDSWDALIRQAQTKSLTESDLEKAGLVVRSEKDTLYDRFRGRLVFTIFNTVGKAIAFGARTLKAEETAKYINSPETPLYQKARVLYGLSHSRSEIRRREEAIVVEGYFDFLSLYQAGIKNVVASSGTAFTREQAQLLGRSAPSVILMFDSDSAGQQAALRSVDYLFEAGLEVKVVMLPKGEDPDSLVGAGGAEAVNEQLSQAQSFVQFSLSVLPDRYDTLSLGMKDKAIKRLTNLAAKLDDPIKRELFLQEISERYGIGIDALKRTVKPTREKPPAPPVSVPTSQLDDDFLVVLLARPELIDSVAEQVAPADLVDKTAADIYRLIITRHQEGQAIDAAQLIDKMSSEAQKQKIASLAAEPVDDEKITELLDDYLAAFKRRRQKRRMADLKEGLATAEREGEQDKIDYYLAEINRLKSKG